MSTIRGFEAFRFQVRYGMVTITDPTPTSVYDAIATALHHAYTEVKGTPRASP